MRKGFLKALFFVLIVLVAINILVVQNNKQGLTSPLTKVSSSKPTPTSTPTPTPTPVPTPTPTPVPTGYCLNVPVLFYHHIDPGFFEENMSYLAQKGYVSISALDLVNALKNHTEVSPNSIVVTLDDGYADQYTNALPIARKYGIRLNLLISSGLVNNPDYMTWDQINEIKSAGGYIINHTWSHNSLAASSMEKIKYEIETSKIQIEQYTGQKNELFGYPYGGYDNRVIQVLNENGFTGAFSTLPGTYQCDSFIMALHRTRIGNASLSYYGL